MTQTKAAISAVLCLYLLPALAGNDKETIPDPWTLIRSFVGEWEGTSQGEAGTGNVKRTYAFVLKDRYLHEKNLSTYPPQGNSRGEVHEHWSFFSYDRARKTLVLRQFHQEGFVNRYTLNQQISKPGKLVFESEQFENFDNKWRAKETYEIAATDEFVEIFELAPPGKAIRLARPPNVDVHRCHNGPKPMDGVDSQPNASNPSRQSARHLA